MEKKISEIVTTAVERTPVGILLTDPMGEDHPITFVNDAFQSITLYSREHALGQNCRFLQGPETEPQAVQAIRDGLAAKFEFQVTITNYRADGSTFTNQLLITPILDEDGETSAHFAVMRPLPDDKTGTPEHNADALDLMRELQHRVKNHLSMVVNMIRLQAKREVTQESFRAVGRRIEALALLYEEMYVSGRADTSPDQIRAGAYLSRIASVVARLGSEGGIRVNVECDEIDLPVDKAARLGLLLSELLTNAFEHAFKGRETGRIDVRFRSLSESGVRLTVEDDGIGLPEDSNWPYEAESVATQKRRARDTEGELDTTGHDGHSGVGGTIIIALTKMIGAKLSVSRALRGTVITIDLDSDD